MIIKKSPEEIERMAAAGAVLVRTMNLLQGKIRPGVTTKELDDAAERFIRSQGGTPAFKGLSVDIGVVLDGWVADAARTFPVGPISPVAQKLLRVTQESLMVAVPVCKVGNHLGDIGHAIQTHVEAEGLSIVRSLVGHGIGREMHEDPQIPNYGNPGSGVPLEDGMVLAIEPMVTAGRHAIRVADDQWSIFSQDGSLAAHFEFTIAITAAGPRVLTPWHEASSGRAAASNAA